ncbi:DUF2934 domain-containing protein [Thiorhodovibrio frisius]|uniref:DUF2934 domain-containing protein n=1 Tax=Thiorhodovibrio frisius TaxID=631362 RepID=H8Z6P5_9GAMM|nr:DUF2934 domain-containing protein [Thiorhodovibrio frisius]EIC20761.1 Protein of unknown function (DUF2934) [Thiorhodovibrio frisius]WPL21509.1 hypothetical protein Thiofri_01635 [Thiorhodovibrio frisius]
MTTTTTPKKRTSTTTANIDPPRYDRPAKDEKVAELAYLKAEQRGFETGHEMDDWLEAEAELAKVD